MGRGDGYPTRTVDGKRSALSFLLPWMCCIDRWGYLTSITGMDLGVEAGVLDHLPFPPGCGHYWPARANAEEHASCAQYLRNGAVVSSMEHEMAEMFGVTWSKCHPPEAVSLKTGPTARTPCSRTRSGEGGAPRPVRRELDDVAEEFDLARMVRSVHRAHRSTDPR